MATIEIKAGEGVSVGDWQINKKGFVWMLTGNSDKRPGDAPFSIADNVKILTQVNESDGTNVDKAVGWGVAGLALFGPIGLLGAVLGGKTKKIVFTCELNDGRKFLAVANMDVWTDILSIRFGK